VKAGLELGLERSISSKWLISGGYALQKAEITETTAAAPKGREVPLVPRDSFSLWNRYDFTRQIGAGVGLIARSKSYATISNAVMTGDGIGKPLGLLNIAAGIPICDTAAGTPAGQFTWQDLVSLKFAVPLQYHKAAVYLCNQATFGLLLAMSDALGRPLMITMRTEASIWYINGSPVRIVSQMPDCTPGARLG
jgi:hypothetical protein